MAAHAADLAVARVDEVRPGRAGRLRDLLDHPRAEAARPGRRSDQRDAPGLDHDRERIDGGLVHAVIRAPGHMITKDFFLTKDPNRIGTKIFRDHDRPEVRESTADSSCCYLDEHGFEGMTDVDVVGVSGGLIAITCGGRGRSCGGRRWPPWPPACRGCRRR